ncbi:hypothetical protein ACFWCB_32610 [Streptomyces sp. NPDC060048]|uniref:hypothetical protein n=1 Tax=unclassified Streptomyces TaxID=2593676 RepID=UPI0036A3413D
MAVRDALRDWRQDATLVCVLPLLCWPALIGALVTRPAPLRAVLLGLLCLPVIFGLRELYAARRARRILREPGSRWTPYVARSLRRSGLPPLLVLDGGRHVLTLGPLGRRVLPPRAWPRGGPALPPPPAPADAPDPPVERLVWLAGDPGPGAVVWDPAPMARQLGLTRRMWRRGAVGPGRPTP